GAQLAQRTAGGRRPLDRRHARVVHDFPASPTQLRPRPIRVEPTASARPASALAGAAMRAGPWYRLTSLAATAGVALVVTTGEWAMAHDVSAHVTFALLVGVVVMARLAHPERPRLVLTAAGAFVLFSVAGLAALAGAPAGLHLAIGGLALAAAAVSSAAVFAGGSRAPRPSWRDYVTLTKPRIM